MSSLRETVFLNFSFFMNKNKIPEIACRQNHDPSLWANIASHADSDSRLKTDPKLGPGTKVNKLDDFAYGAGLGDRDMASSSRP